VGLAGKVKMLAEDEKRLAHAQKGCAYPK